MLHQIFSIYDSKTAAFLPPFYSQTKPSAIRAITDTLSDPAHQFAKHPEDYTLFFLGTYDDGSSAFVIEETPQSLCILIELLSQERASQ